MWQLTAGMCQCASIGPLVWWRSKPRICLSLPAVCCLNSGAWTEVSKARSRGVPSCQVPTDRGGHRRGHSLIHHPCPWKRRRRARLGPNSDPSCVPLSGSGTASAAAFLVAGARVRPGRPRLASAADGAIAAAAGERQRRQLGELGAEAEAGSVLGPPRSSPREVREEMARCFDLVRRLRRGAVYLGSSRVPPTHPHFLQTTELAREIARLLDYTTWTGAGPGLMDAAIQGALEAEKPVGGLKIAKEAGEWTSSAFHPYLPPETYLTCRFFSARKHGLVDAAVRSSPTDRTAVIALPGGVGTLDELFEILALIQLERIGSLLPVPFLLLNYDSCSRFRQLLDFLNDCQEWGTVAPGEVASLWKVCDGNHEALEFYNVPAAQRNYLISPQLKQHRTSYVVS